MPPPPRPVSRPQEGDGGAQGSLCRIPRRRLTGDAGQGHGEGALPAGGLASRSSSALCPAAGPPAPSLSADHEARLGCQGHVQGTFQRRNKMSEEDKGLPCLPRSGGGELLQSPAPASGNLRTPTENEQQPPPLGMRRAARPQTPAVAPQEAPATPREDWPHQGLPDPGSEGQWGAGGAQAGGGGSGQGGGNNGPADVAQNEDEQRQAAGDHGCFILLWALRSS